MEKLKLHSKDFVNENTDKIAELFPHCVTESKDPETGQIKSAIDFDLLRQALSSDLVEGPQERYRLDWPGKREALATANAPIAKTLRPCEDESVDFENTENLYIEGDNLDALKLLQETYLGKVKMIYIDPPYNTGNDFIYDDNYSMSQKEYKFAAGDLDADGNKLFDEEKWRQNCNTNGRFHSEWLSMIFPRLKLARNLLTDDGIILVSIDDNELSQLVKVLNEIYGEEQFIGIFTVVSSPSAIDYGHIAKTNDYCLFYAKDIDSTKTKALEDPDKKFRYKDEKGEFNIYPLYNGNTAFNPDTRPNLHYPFYVNPNSKLDENFYEISLEKKVDWEEVFPVISKKEGISRVWRWGKDKAKLNLNLEIVGHKNENGEFRIVQKSRLTGKMIRSVLDDKAVSSRRGTAEIDKLFDAKVFPFPKPTELPKRFYQIGTGLTKNDLILDFFSGSGSTAQAVMQLNAEDGGQRKHIQIQLPEPCNEKSTAYKAGYSTIAEIGKERIRRAGKAIKAELQAELEKHLPGSDEHTELQTRLDKLDIGFRVLKVDSSNMEQGYYQLPQDTTQDGLAMAVEHIKPDRTAEDLLFQVMLDFGVELSRPISNQEIAGKKVYFVDAGNAENEGASLAACFEGGLGDAFSKALAQKTPLRVVLKDSAFNGNDAARINVEQFFKEISPHTQVRAI